MRRALLAAISAALVSLTAAVPGAQAAFDDPLFFYTPQPSPLPELPQPPPFGYLDGPCGLSVDPEGEIYLSDYYHRSIDVFRPSTAYAGQPLTSYTGPTNPHTGPLDDPCGLALDPSGDLYVNDYHREVVRFPSPVSLATAEVIDTGDLSDPYSNPTGVAVDPATGHVFIDDRTYIAEYDSSGSFVRRVGEGSLGDGYGIAVSGYAGTAGEIYVPDAASDKVKVYDPTFSTTTPKATISGPFGGFGSLVDSAIAVDDATGELYVADTLGTQLSEEPQAIVRVFAANKAYEGRLKHATIAAAPVGLAVDNSGTATQGRVYLTSGIGEGAGLYGYPARAASSAAAAPLGLSSGAGDSGSSASVLRSSPAPLTGESPSSTSPSLDSTTSYPEPARKPGHARRRGSGGRTKGLHHPRLTHRAGRKPR